MQDLAYTGSQDLRFARTRAGDHHYRAFRIVNCLTLAFIQPAVYILEPLMVLLRIAGHYVKIRPFYIMQPRIDFIKKLKLQGNIQGDIPYFMLSGTFQ